MEPALELWRRRRSESWLHGTDGASLRTSVEAQRTLLLANPQPARVNLAALDPPRFVIAFVAALTAEVPQEIYLGETATVAARIPETRVMIPTGGTTRAPRFAVHSWATLTAAAGGLQTWLGGGPIHSVCFLPLQHVSGLMQVVRSFCTGGILTLASWREIEAGQFPAVPGNAVTSLVPTQLARLHAVPGAMAWLRRFRAVFLGGAPAWPELLQRARDDRLPLAPCYGMTETAAQVSALRPEEFLAGREGVGRPLPHAMLEIDAADSSGLGRIRIRAASLFLGYDGETATRPHDLLTHDCGRISTDGFLSVCGRMDAVINTGGEKVDPVEVEAAIRATGLVRDVAVFGLPDREWGERVAAAYEADGDRESELTAAVRQRLASHLCPKRWLRLPSLPRNEAGKIQREVLRKLFPGCD